ncbi:MAG: DNA-processing protein DprA, partial [Alphaproteobacteria bacterium]|nr:DNA-processing protein DprA [Alphaproteobacteria bacterium]
TGCLVSEMPPGFKPRGKDFPRRNRLISGISYGVIVVEAARRSGTLITARLANEQGREVFAVPGHPLDPRAEGTNDLIKSGATLITDAADVLDVIRPMLPVASPSPGVDRQRPRAIAPPPVTDVGDAERNLVERSLGPSPVHIDDLLRATELTAQRLRVVLLELSLAGRLEHHGANLVSLRFEG